MRVRINRWKRFGLFVLSGLLLSWAIACTPGTGSNSGEPASGTSEVEFWTMQLQPQFTDYFNSLIATFESENPEIKVRWVDVPWSAMESKILAAVSAKTAPDVVNLNPNFATLLASRNAWLTLDDQVPAEIRQQYLPNIWKASTLNGTSFGIPWYLTTRISIYNTQLFKEAGIEKPPSTYAELAQVAQQIRDKTGKYALFVTFVPGDSSEVLESMVQMGMQLVDEQGKAAFNTPEGRAAFQYWVDLYKKGLLPREVLTQGHRQAVQLYQAGEIAILGSGPQFFKTIAENAPSIAEVSAAAPQITGQTGKKTAAVMNLVVPRDTDVPEAAVKFALFVTNDQNQLSFAKDANVLPSTLQALQDSHFQALPADASEIDRARIISAEDLKSAEALIPAMEDIQQLQRIIYDNLQGAMLGEQSVDQAVTNAAQQWEARN
ncbi:ABC transporter substrate-binding protein [Laspinema olomoucense]|uniref:ABC transporter substrate-binding protein n=1 Tax=Laspinema olomoucense TaxID=3231600 RepID=UPI0021BA5829|nr:MULTISPECIES: sugar ABC transporter substrate-binding protein [unclassified Laspinema]MCT7973501.1 sugar ABC transporter substrate-binding protein [Laspinema sp. D3d]MCT7995948.1 sugar ABC transporter substrate-binding protein [Laspinema sp. D3c]